MDVIRLGGYDKTTFGCIKEKNAFKKGVADTTGKSESDVLVTSIKQVNSVDVFIFSYY